MIKAIIFDMDGVISDTQKLHAKSESEILSRFGINLTVDEMTERYAGVSTKKFFKELLDEKGVKYDLDELMKEKWEFIIKKAQDGVDEIPGALDLIKKAKQMKMPIAVASASKMEYVKTVLTKLEIINLFDAITSSDEVKHGKPEPDIFLLAAKRLNVEPKFCMVIEDARSGMIAAKKAGMYCIGLVKNRNDDYPADLKVEYLKEIDLSKLKN